VLSDVPGTQAALDQAGQALKKHLN
jgi:hypothetical protein